MKFTVISFGKDRSGLFAPGVAEYTKRLSHVAKVELVELSESKRSGPAAKTDEASVLLGKLKRTTVIDFDRRRVLIRDRARIERELAAL